MFVHHLLWKKCEMVGWGQFLIVLKVNLLFVAKKWPFSSIKESYNVHIWKKCKKCRVKEARIPKKERILVIWVGFYSLAIRVATFIETEGKGSLDMLRHDVLLSIQLWMAIIPTQAISIILIFMEPDQNRRPPHYPATSRSTDPNAPGNYGGLPPMHNNMMPYSYLYSNMHPMLYPTYPYSTYSYPNGSFVPGNSHQWRDGNFHGAGSLANSGYSRSSHPLQNPRVTLPESRDKP